MAHYKEVQLVCAVCGSRKELPVCCGKTMEFDGTLFFCTICGKEKEAGQCCGQPLQVITKIKKLKTELFSEESRDGIRSV